MKYSYTLALLAASLSAVQACVTAHTYLNFDAAGDGGDDTLTVYIFDSAQKQQEVCSWSGPVAGHSGSNTNHLDGTKGCQAGFSADISNNGRTIVYKNDSPTGKYEVTLQNTATHNQQYNCGGVDDHTGHCQEFESCFSDNASNCGTYPVCKLCDYKAVC